MKRAVLVLFIVVALADAASAAKHHIKLANGKSFDLTLPDGFGISVAAQGLKRVRFMARSPDDRIFVTDMYNLTDNKRGVVYILDDFDTATRQFKKLTSKSGNPEAAQSKISSPASSMAKTSTAALRMFSVSERTRFS